MITLALPTGQFHGWGVCGKWIAREMAAIAPTQLITNLKTLAQAGSPAEVELLRSLIIAPPEGPTRLSGPLFKEITATQMVPSHPNLRGNPTVGYCFFETDFLLPEWLQTARENYDFVLTGSSWCTQVLRAHGLSKVGTLIQGVDTGSFNTTAPPLPARRDGFVIFSGGKFEFRKGQDLVLRAVAIMQQRHKDVFLVNAWFNQYPDSMQTMTASRHMKHFTVEGGYRSVMTQLAQANGLDISRVGVLGVTPNAQMPAVYHRSDIGLFPNRCEGGTNLVLMEYMACGKPVIASWTSGHRDILTDQNSLILRQQQAQPVQLARGVIATWDESSIDEIVAKLEWAYQNRDAIRAIGAVAARDLAMRPWSRTARELLGFLAAV